MYVQPQHPDQFVFKTAEARAKFISNVLSEAITYLSMTPQCFPALDREVASEDRKNTDLSAENLSMSLEAGTTDRQVEVLVRITVRRGVVSLTTVLSCNLRRVMPAAAREASELMTRLATALQSIEIRYQVEGRTNGDLAK